MSETNSASGGIYIEVNGKDLMANKIKNDRKFHIREDLSTQQLKALVDDAISKSDLASEANKKVSQIADEELGLVDKDGNPCTLAQKKAEIDKRKDFPYNILIIGWLIKKFQIATLESEHAEKRAEIKGRDPWNKIFTSQEIEKEKKMAEANKKKVTNLGTLIGGAYKYMKENKLLNEKQVKAMDEFCKAHGIKENDSINKEALKRIAEAEQKDPQQNRVQEGAIETDQAQQQTQTQTQQVTIVKAPVQERGGLQFTGLGDAGASISSGAIGVGKGQSQGKSSEIQI